MYAWEERVYAGGERVYSWEAWGGCGIPHLEEKRRLVAAAGSGKTHVVHQRVTHLVEVYNLQAPNILTLTFARDACKEVKGRFLRSPADQ